MLISHTTHSHTHTDRQYEYTDMHRKQLRTFLFPIRPAYRFPPAPRAAKRKQRNFIMRRQNKGKLCRRGMVACARRGSEWAELSWAELSRIESRGWSGDVRSSGGRLAATAAKHDPLCGSKPHFNPCCLSFVGGCYGQRKLPSKAASFCRWQGHATNYP